MLKPTAPAAVNGKKSLKVEATSIKPKREGILKIPGVGRPIKH